MDSAKQLFVDSTMCTAEEFYHNSKRVQGILEDYELLYGITDGGLSAATGLNAWMVICKELIYTENELIKHLPQYLISFINSRWNFEDEDKLMFNYWNDLATAVNEFIKSDGSERNYFISTQPEEWEIEGLNDSCNFDEAWSKEEDEALSAIMTNVRLGLQSQD